MSKLPDRNLCDKYGNLLVYEKNRQIWSIVSYTHYLDFAVCYQEWAYLPVEPEFRPKEFITADDVDLMGRLCALILSADFLAVDMVRKHMDKFTESARAELLKAYSKLDGSFGIEYVLDKLKVK